MSNTEATAAAVAEQGANVAPEKASSKKGASQKKGAPKAAKTAKKAAAPKKETAKSEKATSKKASKAATPREGSKKEIVISMLRAKGGATMAEIAKATDWQNHSIRGFVSGQLTKKMGLTIESSKNEAGERVYHIAK
jgi:hypothetical protein